MCSKLLLCSTAEHLDGQSLALSVSILQSLYTSAARCKRNSNVSALHFFITFLSKYDCWTSYSMILQVVLNVRIRCVQVKINGLLHNLICPFHLSINMNSTCKRYSSIVGKPHLHLILAAQ